MLAIQQNSFSAGELTPSLYARSDLDMYRIGAASAENFVVNYHGGLFNRTGFKYIAPAGSKTVALIEFVFSNQQTYILVFTPNKIKIIKNGAYLMNGATPLEVNTPYTAADLARLTHTQSADVLTLFHNNHQMRELRRYSETDWRLVAKGTSGGPFETINTEATDVIYSSGQSGAVTLTANFAAFTPQMQGKLIYLEQRTGSEVATWIQRMQVSVGDKAYYNNNYYECVEARVIGGKAAQTGDRPPIHTEGDVWDGPNKDIPDDGRDCVIGVLWRYLHSGYGVARITTVFSDQVASAEVIGTLPESIVGPSVVAESWTFAGQTTQRTFDLLTPPATGQFASDYKVTLIDPSGAVADDPLSYPAEWTINVSTKRVTLYIDPQVQDPSGPGMLPRNVIVEQKSSERGTYKWAVEPWRADTGYPQCGTYYQQRFCVASTESLPQTLWMSRIDAFNDFGTSKPLLADDAMRFDVNSFQVNEIYHMAPLNALLVFTSGGVWSINQGSNDVITPETPPSVRVQSYDASATLRPIITGATALYVQDGQKIVRDISFEFSRDSYVGNDLTVRASHLFEDRKIVSWAYAKNPHKLIWCAFDDGEMAAFCYMPEQQLWGWTPCKTDGKVTAVGAVREGDEDALYIAVERFGTTNIERMQTRYVVDERDRFYVDSGLTYDGRQAGGNPVIFGDNQAFAEVTVNGNGYAFDSSIVGRFIQVYQDDCGSCKRYQLQVIGLVSQDQVVAILQERLPDGMIGEPWEMWDICATTLSGLEHLNGQTVAIVADASEVAPQVVTDGQVKLPSAYGIVHVGLPYTATLQTLDMELASGIETTKTKRKNVGKVSVYTRNTKAIKAGTSIDRVEELKSRIDENYGLSPRGKTEVVDITCDSSWSKRGRVFVVQDSPFNAEILAVIPEVVISD